jgi:hypothetical protein
MESKEQEPMSVTEQENMENIEQNNAENTENTEQNTVENIEQNDAENTEQENIENTEQDDIVEYNGNDNFALVSLAVSLGSLVLSFLFIPEIVGIILGILGLKSKKKNLAKVGMGIGIMSFFLGVIMLAAVIPNVTKTVVETRQIVNKEPLDIAKIEDDLITESAVGNIVQMEGAVEEVKDSIVEGTVEGVPEEGQGLIENDVALSNEEAESELESGYMEGNLYINDSLGFSISFPEDWQIQNDQQIEMLYEAGDNYLTSNNEEFKESIEYSQDVNEVFTIVALKYPVETTGELNPNVIVTGEDISQFTTIKTGEDYNESAIALLENLQAEVTVNEIGNLNLGGTIFDGVELLMEVNGIEMKERFYSVIIDETALSIVITYYDRETYNDVMNIVNTLEFN